ncbi:MAG: transcription-repair coupling factor, partial [Deltaproteobacteria bacterium]|nr:transcription-repair coupling factor [Deltaproteobacteria bacterium]
WENKKKRAKKAVEEVAKELLQLYAERQVVEGFPFSRGERLFSEFEASFEYDETPDQVGAIEDVIRDMEEPKPMDRLICGDVGYGKTEVAMRSAFKAVLDGKQMAVLVPTTVLAQQHYLTFKKRFASYPVIVEVLSRFKSPKEQREILGRLSRGEIDIIIGTHRLLQKDVAFKDLGLVVIDEEQRFGVAHKERLKEIRKQVDVLTLTATPIPRTLHISLAGIRDLSIINTPPEDRIAIKTMVARLDDSTIREAVLRELGRGGQVFFVHNRVQSIGAMEAYLKKLIPEARVAVAHGQMRERHLEKVMYAFVNKEYDLLLSTAIIESGLDIPSANTIIINRADRFGLADLYQLRGRVGRSSHRAYAYLLIPPDGQLTGDSRKRLKVLQELTELGSGFRLATYDLEIRGAGELLGHAQSGHIAEVGFDMYNQMLEEAVRNLKGEVKEVEIEPEIDLRIPAYIPENYIQDTGQRLNIYKRLASTVTEDEAEVIRVEMRDRFGEVPVLVDNLLEVVKIKLMLKKLRISNLSVKGNRLFFTFSADTKVSPERVVALVNSAPKRFRFTPGSKLIAIMDGKKTVWEEVRWLLQQLM